MIIATELGTSAILVWCSPFWASLEFACDFQLIIYLHFIEYN